MLCQQTTWGTTHPDLAIERSRCEVAPVGAEADLELGESAMGELTWFECEWRGGIGGDHSPRDFPGGCVIYIRSIQAPRRKIAPVGREADGVPVRCGVSGSQLRHSDSHHAIVML
jgi:hypothetical protein